MKALIIYESLWGNTEKVARAVAAALAGSFDVEVFDSDTAPTAVTDYDLIVVGGPTHAFSMTRPTTRRGAVEQNHAPHEPRRGIREWLAELSPATREQRAVTFDTRVDSPRLPGSAAKAARHELRSLGFETRDKPMTFRVHGYEGPLRAGEVERAGAWARGLETKGDRRAGEPA